MRPILKYALKLCTRKSKQIDVYCATYPIQNETLTLPNEFLKQIRNLFKSIFILLLMMLKQKYNHKISMSTHLSPQLYITSAHPYHSNIFDTFE